MWECLAFRRGEGAGDEPVVMDLGSAMTKIARALAFGRSLVADDFGGASTRLALLIGGSASAVLVLVRIGAAFAAH